ASFRNRLRSRPRAARKSMFSTWASWRSLARRLGVSRRHLFETVERPALATLPAEDYEFAEWRLARVSTDYHVEFKSFFYSVPHGRIAAHQRRYGGPRFGTDPDHMPSSHRRYAEWTPDRFRRWGASIGPETEGLVTAILASRPHSGCPARSAGARHRRRRTCAHASRSSPGASGSRWPRQTCSSTRR